MRTITNVLIMLVLTGYGVLAQKNIPLEIYTLDNGLTIVLNEDPLATEVFGLVVVRAGGKDDPADATGMAHYQEHMLFKGTTELGTIDWEAEKKHIDRIFELYDQLGATEGEEARAKIQQQINEESLKANEYVIPNEFSNLVNAMGGTNLNANTSPDRTVYFNSFPPDQLNAFIDLYSHRFMEPVFRGFQAELEVVYEEKNMYSDMFQFTMLQEFDKQFFKNHPYGQQSLIGTSEDLKNPSLSKMYKFFKDWYVPNNMAVIISGNFNAEQVKPIIAEKFGRLQSKEIPERKSWDEKPIEGRELVEVNLSPIKLAILGFRTVPHGHPDELALEIANQVLSNREQTGLLDELVTNNEVMAANVIHRQMNDHGSGLFLIIPKIVGQNLEDAEKLVLDKVQKLKAGEFDDTHLEAIKRKLYRNFELSLENIQQKALAFGETFGRNKSIKEYLEYPQKLQAIGRDDVLRVANQYYGDNYLAYFSKMGKAPKDKIAKPGYKPLEANTNAKSKYALHFETIPSVDLKMEYLDFDKVVQESKVADLVTSYHVENKLNDVFTLRLKFGIGQYEMPLLSYASQLMDYAGTKDLTAKELKNQFAALGATLNFYASDSYTQVVVTGIDSELAPTLELLNQLLDNPVVDPAKINNIVEGEKTNRKMEDAEAPGVARALREYVYYGKKSGYLDRLSIKEISKLEVDELLKVYAKARTYETQVHYTGSLPAQEVNKVLAEKIDWKPVSNPSKGIVVKSPKTYKENTVFLVDKSKVAQTQIEFLINGDDSDVEYYGTINAFNQYFGGGFSGLVLQEIREYRSLAYSAQAYYIKPDVLGKPTYFRGAMSTQLDKTVEAVEVYNGLMREMPMKPERMPMIKSYLSKSAFSSRPSLRRISQQILDWKAMGYERDPAEVLADVYQQISFDDVAKFYETSIKNKPIVTIIVTDLKQVDRAVFEKYGKIIEVKEKDLFLK